MTTTEGTTMTNDKPMLHDYKTGETIREATYDELESSRYAANRDGGAGVIVVDGRSCYVAE